MKKFASRLLIVLAIAIVSSFGLSACGQKHLKDLKDATAVSAGSDNFYGQLGNDKTEDSSVPVTVKSASD